ncbi:prepilin-type N-terminal cleavage/methylation domain-containing protein [Desulfovibrio ferrophilus]|uniref:Putative type II secretion system protein n=1 Tax=Desulfovibrio ferrophilus TaxID=241368 RepID=A0A2Z6AZU1_9BACT|nr:prepilin-type N-terminal cleavage/methylation domain-containing protein [Desulfovibrio ferrophilus]BBD08713.1 putative type II secretion system protein [Desulfovibrio ferrophilus]
MNRNAKGFTLVEMAIVLVIIGIILAGVMKGRDIVRGAQVKQFSQQFAQKWATVAQTYYDKTGNLLIDGAENGGSAASADGQIEGGLELQIGAAGGAEEVLRAVGITPCTLIKSKLTTPVTLGSLTQPVGHCDDSGTQTVNVVQTTIEGEYTGTQVVQVDLGTLAVTVSGQDLLRNFVIIYNCPTDVAQGLDTAIDGRVGGDTGSCVALSVAAAGGTTAALTIPGLATAPIATQPWDPASNGNTQTLGIMMDY